MFVEDRAETLRWESTSSPVQVSAVVEPVGQRAAAVEGEALVEDVEGHVLKAVVVQRHLQEEEET